MSIDIHCNSNMTNTTMTLSIVAASNNTAITGAFLFRYAARAWSIVMMCALCRESCLVVWRDGAARHGSSIN